MYARLVAQNGEVQGFCIVEAMIDIRFMPCGNNYSTT